MEKGEGRVGGWEEKTLAAAFLKLSTKVMKNDIIIRYSTCLLLFCFLCLTGFVPNVGYLILRLYCN